MREFLSDHKIEFTERNIRRDPEARQYIIDALGVEAVPLTLIDGETVIGFDQTRLEALLNIQRKV
ncbi:MAG: glutaredoxin domain-containing protein [Anaerolineae bacterium]|nr:glutaredoxin family protein [Anaerolineales bacterium]MCQ3976265.1 glutaredoxin family protein [Anaerolineae bacterium]